MAENKLFSGFLSGFLDFFPDFRNSFRILDFYKKLLNRNNLKYINYKKLVIILKGKTVLQGYLKDIKEEYKKKDIFIKGDVTKEELMNIKGVVDVIEGADEFEVIIESVDNVSDVFDVIKKKKNITKFEVQEPSLNEIFVTKVGEEFDK